MRIFKYLLFVLILFIGTNYIYAHTFDNSLKVYDYAQVLTEKEQEKIKSEVNEYINNNNIDMVIVIVRNHTYDSIEKYSDEFYKKNEFGIGNDKSGIILVVDIKKDELIIKAYGKALTQYNDLEITRTIESINNTNKIYNKVQKFIKSSNSYIDYDLKDKNKKIYKSINFVLPLIISIFSSTFIIVLILIKLKNKKSNIIDPYLIDNYVLNKCEESFSTTSTKQIN